LVKLIGRENIRPDIHAALKRAKELVAGEQGAELEI
jgi:hypothetical protein